MHLGLSKRLKQGMMASFMIKNQSRTRMKIGDQNRSELGWKKSRTKKFEGGSLKSWQGPHIHMDMGTPDQRNLIAEVYTVISIFSFS